MIDPNCADCVHWDSRDGLVGFCAEITDHLGNDPVVLVHGLAPCRTSASGRCARFEASGQALDRLGAERAHLRALARGAGTDYPASLAPAAGYPRAAAAGA